MQEDYRERLYRESLDMLRLAKALKQQRAISPKAPYVTYPSTRHAAVFKWMLSQNDRDFLRIQGIRPE